MPLAQLADPWQKMPVADGEVRHLDTHAHTHTHTHTHTRTLGVCLFFFSSFFLFQLFFSGTENWTRLSRTLNSWRRRARAGDAHETLRDPRVPLKPADRPSRGPQTPTEPPLWD